jgi:dTDP-4-dehydrorhamnose reductase
MALAAQAVDAILVHISTDYVFDGRKGVPYTVKDRPNPISTYGLSKYYGELAVQELLDTSYIIRTSWLYGIHKHNFVEFVLSSARQGREVNIINDQYGTPTWTGSLCQLIERIFTSGGFGLYHAADSGVVSRYDQALAICRGAGLSTEHIRSISRTEFSQPAARPQNSALDCAPLEVSHWETSLQAYLKQYFERFSSEERMHHV